MGLKNAIYAQSGGVTAVINVSASAVIQTLRHYPDKINKIFAAKNGILGVFAEEFIDLTNIDDAIIAQLLYTPGGAFGSCRYKLQSNQEEYIKLINIFKKYDIGYFFYNGGGDSMDTVNQIATFSQELDYPIICIGIPKTIDNDLPYTDNCPGFGSVAKYIAISTKEAGFDIASMCTSSTKIFILEVMGRHTGWIAAASALANDISNEPPHIILFPEVPLHPEKFLKQVEATILNQQYCVIVVSDGLRTLDGQFLTDSITHDAFGHAQLGGVAPIIANMIKEKYGYKYHWAVADYLQRSARHIAAQTDVEQAYALGKTAVILAMNNHTAIMPIIKRISNNPYQWEIGQVALDKVANQEKKLPLEFIAPNGMHITPACREYLEPLIQGEAYPLYKNGIPDYIKF